MISVGKRVNNSHPPLDNFINILCLTKSTEYGSLSPYVLENNVKLPNNKIIRANIENIWQFSKIYEWVEESTQRKSIYDKTIIWQHPKELHFYNNSPTKSYWDWRFKGFMTKEPIRYPNGFNHRHKCLFSIIVNEKNDLEYLNYIDARKRIYLPNFYESIDNLSKNTDGYKKYQKLLNYLRDGKNINIIEIDGPHYESLNYYKEKYNVNDNFILSNNTTIINEEKLNIFLNDPKHPFGHGYCLAWKLIKDLN